MASTNAKYKNAMALNSPDIDGFLAILFTIPEKSTPRPTAAPKSGATANPAAISFAASVSIFFLQS